MTEYLFFTAIAIKGDKKSERLKRQVKLSAVRYLTLDKGSCEGQMTR
jgi:hypothetical protein